MKAVIYARYSSDNQREESITAQVRACTEYAERQGYTVIKTYTDEARSATTDDRPGFLRMVDEIKFGSIKPDIVLVHKLDRFARNRYDSAYYKRELRKMKVRVESVLERLDDSPESVLYESLLEGYAEYYSRNLSREVMKGMRETAYQGRHCGGIPPLGYDVDKEGRYVINEAEAQAVRLIFEMRHAGHGYGAIIKALNDHGYTSKVGHLFGKNSLHDILRNKKYIGIYVFNRSSSKAADGTRNSHHSKDASEIIEVAKAFPPIIDEELFYDVQSQMDAIQQQNGKGRHKAKVAYLLSGIIWCGECQSKMAGASSSYLTRISKEHRKRYYYECNFGKRTKGCDNLKINKDYVENYVLIKLKDEILSETSIPVLAQSIIKHHNDMRRSSEGEGDFLEKEIKKIDGQIANVIEAITFGGGMIRSLTEQLKLLESKRSGMEVRLADWQAKQEKEALTLQGVVDYLRTYLIRLQSGDPMEVRRVVETFVDKVVIKKDTVEVFFKVSVDSCGGGGGS